MAAAEEDGMTRSRERRNEQPGPATKPAADGTSSLEGRIRAQYGDLPVSERRIADLILEFPGEVAAYSATELAELSGGSKAAVTRLVQRLGFANFDEARRAARDAQAWGSPLYLLSREPPTGEFGARVQEQIDQDVRNITLTLESLRGDLFDEIVVAICDARRVLLLGYRNSHYLAGYARSQILQVRGGVYLLPAAGETIAEEIADMTGEDVLIVIGFRRRIAEVPRAMAAAQTTGAKVLYVTDWLAEPAPDATWTVPCAVHGKDLFDRYASAMTLLHFLGVAIVNRLAAKGRGRLQRIENLHEDLHDFG
jgi:DNA-binding MurR/RpiR family transcriptional regulator